VRQLTGQEGDSARLKLMALRADPDRHGPVQQQECLVVPAVDVHRGGVAAPGMHVDDGQLPTGDGSVENDRELIPVGVGQPLMLDGPSGCATWSRSG
jgi:hypothetical protein